VGRESERVRECPLRKEGVIIYSGGRGLSPVEKGPAHFCNSLQRKKIMGGLSVKGGS